MLEDKTSENNLTSCSFWPECINSLAIKVKKDFLGTNQKVVFKTALDFYKNKVKSKEIWEYAKIDDYKTALSFLDYINKNKELKDLTIKLAEKHYQEKAKEVYLQELKQKQS